MRFLIMTIVSLFCFTALAGGGGAQGQKFQKVIYVAFGGSASASGSSYDAAKPFVTGNLWAIPTNAIVEKAYVIVDVAITGTTVLNIGDEDGATSWCPTAAITLATPGMYCWDAKNAGAYARISTPGATDAGDIYVVPNAKLYSTAGKHIALANTTANTAGKMRVVVEGYYAGTKP